MALIVLTSANGSPGVSTTALALALNWPRSVVLVEADPTGASSVFAGYFGGRHEPAGGLINLAVAAAAGHLAQSLAEEMVLLDGNETIQKAAWFLPGAQSHEQAPSLLALWQPLADVLRTLDANGQDVIVDAGRLGLHGSPEPLILGADLTLLVTRNTLPALKGAHSWANTLRNRFAEVGGLSRLGVLLVDEQGRWPITPTGARVRPYSASNVAKTLQIPVLSEIPFDAPSAEVYSYGVRTPRKFESSSLVRSYRAAASSLLAVVGDNKAALATTVGGAP